MVGLKMMIKYSKVSDAFLRLDANRNGQITKAELKRFFRNCNVPDGCCDQFFAYMDKDDSGAVDYMEMRGALAPYIQPGPGNREQGYSVGHGCDMPPNCIATARHSPRQGGSGHGPSDQAPAASTAHGPSHHMPSKRRPASARAGNRTSANTSWSKDYMTAFPPRPPNEHLDTSYMEYCGMIGEPIERKVDRQSDTGCVSSISSTTASSVSSNKGGHTAGAYVDDRDTNARLLAVHTTRGGDIGAGPVCFIPAKSRYNRTFDSEGARAGMSTRTDGVTGLYDAFPSKSVGTMMRGGGSCRFSGAMTERVPAGIRRKAFPDGRSELKDHTGNVIYIPGASGRRLGAPTAAVDHAGVCIYGVEDYTSGECMNSVMSH